jgi:hypothetical protein
MPTLGVDLHTGRQCRLSNVSAPLTAVEKSVQCQVQLPLGSFLHLQEELQHMLLVKDGHMMNNTLDDLEICVLGHKFRLNG